MRDAAGRLSFREPGIESHVAASLRASGLRVVVTGAGGWLGMATLELLAWALGDDFDSRVVAFGSSARRLELRGGITIQQQPLSLMARLEARPSLLLHYAFPGRERAEALSEATYRATCERLTGEVLGALDRIGVEAAFVASSGAAGRADDPAAPKALRTYGALKHAEERRFAEWARQGAGRAVIGRVFSVTGPWINKRERYAIAAFLNDAMAGQPILVRAPSRVVRSYVAIREIVSLALALMFERCGENVIRFDTGGVPRELEAVARAVASHWPGVPVVRAPITGPAADTYHGDGAEWARLLERHAIRPVPFVQQVAETAQWLDWAAAVMTSPEAAEIRV